MININRAFSYPFGDEEWPIKILIGAAISACPIANFISVGYMYKIFKSVLNGGEPYLPEWDDFKELFFQGLWLFLIGLCYIVPPMIVGSFGMTVLFIGVLVLFAKVSVGVTIVIIGVSILAVSFFLVMLIAFLYPMAVANYAKGDENYTDAFRIFDIFKRILKVFGDYIIAFVVIYAAVFAMLALLVFPLLGIMFSIVSIFFAFYISYLLWPALFGSACANAFEGDTAPKTALKQRRPAKKEPAKKGRKSK
ncbi:MAG: DUF4013 domain-containing protein [Deltaproteobacteria bacterium]|uniref:DUF4013 domain-containing protein n=1 Tax=Candidatus Zymogenus saltonus TaxID=2844893 RepID=A0A9D8PMN1_9DELT|nr:DUF4013 domain-containing protein [Candidatus Zymogenus saltonus]